MAKSTLLPVALVLALAGPGSAWGYRPTAVTARTGEVVVLRIGPADVQGAVVRAGRAADRRGEHDRALAEFDRAARLGRCDGRCELHRMLSRDLLASVDGMRQRPDDPVAQVSMAIALHNKLVSLRLDPGVMPSPLVRRTRRHYGFALRLTEDRPVMRTEVLLGFAAFCGELGRTEEALGLYDQVDLVLLETATALGNLAYFHATVGHFERALITLERALTLDGPRGPYRQWAETSDDYHRVRHLKGFRELLEMY